VALLCKDRDADRNHPDQGICPVVAAAHCLPTTASSPLIQFLLTAREAGISPNQLRQETNPALGPLAPAGRLVLMCARRHHNAGLGGAKTGQSGANLSRP